MSVAVRVGTIGNRASSWLRRTSSPATACFSGSDLGAGGRLFGRVAAEEAVGRPVRADAVLGPESLHGRGRHAEAAGLVQVVGQFGVGPVGAVEALLGRPVDDPLAEDRDEVVAVFWCVSARLLLC